MASAGFVNLDAARSWVQRFVEWYNAMPWTGKPILVGFNTADSAAAIETWSDASTLEASLQVLSKMQF